MWQKCPICNGAGVIPTSGIDPSKACPTCNGARIISSINGTPPVTSSTTSTVNKMNPFAGDFRDANMESQDEYFGKK